MERVIRQASGDRVRANVVPGITLVLVALAVIPALVAGASQIITAVTPIQMVERDVPTDLTLIDMSGLAMVIPIRLPAATDTSGAPEYAYLVRETVPERRFVLVRSLEPPDRLAARWVIARVVRDPASDGTLSTLAGRAREAGAATNGAYLLETDAVGAAPEDLGSVDDALARPDGTLVRLGVVFGGEAIPLCAETGSGCDRRLAGGQGPFDQLAADPVSGRAVIVRTAYPASAAPVRFVGPQVRDSALIGEVWQRGSVQTLAGWGTVLSTTFLQDSPSLPVDRLWWGPIVCAIAALLLWIGGRIGYPLFEPTAEGSRRWIELRVEGPLRPVPVIASGHIAPPDGGRLYLDDEAGTFIPPGPTELVAVLELTRGDTRLPLRVPAHTGTLGNIERGYLIRFHRRRPALWIHWFGTDLRLTFATDGERDMAATAIGS